MLFPVMSRAGPWLTDPRSDATNVCSVQKRKMQTAIAPAVLAVRIQFCRRRARTKGIHFMELEPFADSTSAASLPRRSRAPPAWHIRRARCPNGHARQHAPEHLVAPG